MVQFLFTQNVCVAKCFVFRCPPLPPSNDVSRAVSKWTCLANASSSSIAARNWAAGKIVYRTYNNHYVFAHDLFHGSLPSNQVIQPLPHTIWRDRFPATRNPSSARIHFKTVNHKSGRGPILCWQLRPNSIQQRSHLHLVAANTKSQRLSPTGWCFL